MSDTPAKPQRSSRASASTAASTAPSPTTREQLLEAHAAARHRRNAAALGSEAYKEAVIELERIEVEIARIEREAVPPRM